MSWTDTIPVLSGEMMEDFEKNAGSEERQELDLWFKPRDVINPQPFSRHLVSVSIDGRAGQADGQADADAGMTSHPPSAADTGYWKRFIEPITETLPTLLKELEGITVRVYLAPNLEFLVPDLSDAGCEIYLMEHFFTEHSLGTLWKYLAFAESNRFITTQDPSLFRDVVANLTRTETLAGLGLACWREPRCVDRATQTDW